METWIQIGALLTSKTFKGVVYMSVILLIMLVASLLLGIRSWRRKRIRSFLFFSPLILVAVFAGYFFFQSSYHTTPDSLQVSVDKENNTYEVTGTWKDRLDFYRFPSDFLVFYVPNNEKVLNVNRDRMKDYKEADWSYLNHEVRDWVERESPNKWEPQIFDLKTDEQFSFSFILPENVKPNDVTLYYAHTREEPMDALAFWLKRIELK
ncbi:hypothetical protein KUV80_16320 [Fictibacillus nanhaiensis]|uniref:hypothetical protein n=1 Tax=Fictibacillus nanhaiensis TaxID=742169 RepID=UPI001C9519C0|nr:hypothetical protein [Fictibacillus nanhaiensis]MBY6038227.1 hypothetical protein [Fictibacillus nanhaiensis]